MTAAGCLQDRARPFITGSRPGAVCVDLSDVMFVDLARFRALSEACGALQRRCASVELAGRPASLDRIADLMSSSDSAALRRLPLRA